MLEDERAGLLFPTQPDRLDSRAGDAQISLPVAAAHPDTANALALISRAYLPTRSTLRWITHPPSLKREGGMKTLNLMTLSIGTELCEVAYRWHAKMFNK